MPSRPSISIISAIYNAEKTLERCIESILSQTFQDFELLLVNDGSKDDSGKILDSYARYDNRIKVFHKNNEGVGATRQFGMDHSSGKYIIHIDPDDWIEPNTLELLYNAATLNSVGIAICNWTYFGPNGTELKQHQKPSKLDSKSLIDDILNGKLLGGVCNKLISSTIAKKQTFESGIDYCEDVLFLAKICSNNNFPITYVDKPLYNYDKSDCSSITSGKYTRNKYNSERNFYNEIIKVYPDITDYQKSRIIGQLSMKAFVNRNLSCYEFYKHFHKERKLIRIASINKKLKLLILLSSFGFYPICRMIYAIYLKSKQ